MAATTYTGVQIRQELATEHGDWVFLGEGVGTSAANYIADTERLQATNLPSGAFDNCIVRIASGTRQGETTTVDYLDAENGRLYLASSLTGAIAAGDDYEIWLRGIDPDMVDRLRDQALTKWCSTWRPLPLTRIVDGDFEESGVTNWTVAGGATRSKALASNDDELSGRWNLSVVVTTANTDYVESAGISVQPGQLFYLEAPVSAYVTATGAAATATLVVRDVDNGASITLGGVRSTHTGRGWGKISVLFTIPSGCYQIKIRLSSSTAASTVTWGPIACHRRRATRMNLPDRIRSKFRVGTQYMTTNPSSASSEQGQEYKVRQFKNTERVQLGNRVTLYFNPGLSEEAVWYYERGYFNALQTSAQYLTVAGRVVGDGATTDCPIEYITAVTAALVAEFYMQKYGAEWQDDFVQAKSRWNYWEGQFGPEPKMVMENETPISIPQLGV